MNYATITNGRVQLWKKGWNTPRCTVCKDATNAVVYGDELVVTFRNGSTTVFRITPSGTNTYALRTIR